MRGTLLKSLMKSGLALTIVGLLLSGCTVRPANSSSDSQTPAQSGGAFNGGGGGNTTAESPVTVAYLKVVLPQVIAILPYVLHGLEGATVGDQTEMGELLKTHGPAIHRKLFANADSSKNIYRVLTRFHYSILESGVCTSPIGEDVDASAKLVGDGEVCLSFERLSKKLSESNSWSKLTALMAHEVSHLLGTTEPEAQFIQQLIEGQVTSETFRNFREFVSDLRAATSSVSRDLESASVLVSGGDQIKTCVAFGRLNGQIQEIQNVQSKQIQQGLMLLSIREQYSLVALLVQASFLASYCESQPEIQKRNEQLFGGQAAISVGEALRVSKSELSETALALIDPNLKVYRVAYGDPSAANSQLTEMIKTVKSLSVTANGIQPLLH